jgi:hypothetical protein
MPSPRTPSPDTLVPATASFVSLPEYCRSWASGSFLLIRAADYFFVSGAGAGLLSCATGRTPIFFRSLSRTSWGDGGLFTG